MRPYLTAFIRLFPIPAACPISKKTGNKDACNGQGVCKEGKCVCNPGFVGEACDEKPCLNMCSGNGKCIDGSCFCKQGFRSEDCSKKDCPTDCGGNGACKDGSCICKPGWGGADCMNSTSPPARFFFSSAFFSFRFRVPAVLSLTFPSSCSFCRNVHQ